MFSSVPWEPVLHSIAQTFTLYWIALAGLKLTGRRVFAERSPQDLLILLLVAESANIGLVDEEAGYWGTIASISTLFLLGGIVERIPFLRDSIQGKPVMIYEDGVLHGDRMKKHLLDLSDLEETARRYGVGSYRDFSRIILEGDGHITGILPYYAERKVQED